MMDTEEVERLLDEYRRTGDRSARNRVVEGHLTMARFTVRQLSKGDPALAEDLRQVALLAIVHAADRYRPGKGASFRTFAGRTIDGELKRHLRDKTWAVRPPRSRQEHYLRVCRAREELTQELGRGPTPTEIAERTDLLLDEVLGAIEAGGARTPNALEPARDGEDAGTVRAEVMSWDGSYAAFESHADLHRAVGVLDDRERGVLHLRFIDELSQPEIASRLGISQSYVSRIIRGALAKLRDHMDDERFAAEPVSALRRTA
jgi:RNA polymerase sigma-B factor